MVNEAVGGVFVRSLSRSLFDEVVTGRAPVVAVERLGRLIPTCAADH